MTHRINAPLQDITHTDLKRFSDSSYKSECPVCPDGILPVVRSPNADFTLFRFDVCVGCGQQFRYTDARINGELVLPPFEEAGITEDSLGPPAR